VTLLAQYARRAGLQEQAEAEAKKPSHPPNSPLHFTSFYHSVSDEFLNS